MANITPTTTDKTNFQDKGILVQWGPMANADVGLPFSGFGGADRSIQVEGTLGAGFAAVVEGSNDATNYETLTDHLGNALTLSAKGLKSIDQICLFLRPRVTGGDGTTAVTFSLLARRGANV